MSENPTPDTATPDTETGEKMIPLSAVEPLLRWAQQRLALDIEDRLLRLSYDHAAKRLHLASLAILSHEPAPSALARLPPLR